MIYSQRILAKHDAKAYCMISASLHATFPFIYDLFLDDFREDMPTYRPHDAGAWRPFYQSAFLHILRPAAIDNYIGQLHFGEQYGAPLFLPIIDSLLQSVRFTPRSG